jgi:hypothetical protein
VRLPKYPSTQFLLNPDYASCTILANCYTIDRFIEGTGFKVDEEIH